MTITVHIVGAVSGSSIDSHTIQELLATEEEGLSHGNEFTGKPTTILHVNDNFVLKGQRDLNFSSLKIAEAWANKQLEKESKTRLYHPNKTWFIIEQKDTWSVYNISPRLIPIHLAIEAPDISTADKLAYLTKLTDMYLMHAAKHNERLDEGLSNFGHDEHGDIYYLDDDFYAWDYILSFTSMVALWLRLFSDQWFDNDVATDFAKTLQMQLHHHFKDHRGVDYPGVVHEHINCLFFNQISLERARIITSILRQKVKAEATTKKETEPAVQLTPPKELMQNFKDWLNDDEPIAVIADIHANLPALEAVLEDIKQQNITRMICLGDIVGYGPHPQECIKRIQALDILTIRGNHDHMIGNETIISNISQSGAYVAQWTVKQLTPAQQEWLCTLPLQLRTEDWIIVHGAPRDATFFNAYVYDRTSDSNLEWMQENNFEFCFHGHSHLQGFYQAQMGVNKLHKKLQDYSLDGYDANLICPGSVGQPRGGNPGAEYVVFNPGAKKITFKRISYNIASVADDMRKFGFPDQLPKRLEEGF